jgi:hypothetical protein
MTVSVATMANEFHGQPQSVEAVSQATVILARFEIPDESEESKRTGKSSAGGKRCWYSQDVPNSSWFFPIWESP